MGMVTAPAARMPIGDAPLQPGAGENARVILALDAERDEPGGDARGLLQMVPS